MGVEEDKPTVTIRVSNIPHTVVAKDIFHFFESTIGKDSVFACQIVTERNDWKSKGFGRVQFESVDAKSAALSLSEIGNVFFKGNNLSISSSFDDIIFRPIDSRNRVTGILHAGLLSKEDCMCVTESWEGVKAWIMPERKCLEFWINYSGVVYRLEIQYSNVLEASLCCLETENPNAILLKLKHAPNIYQKISGPDIKTKFRVDDRYHFCKENFEFRWVRTTDFSSLKSIGHSSAFCFELEEGSQAMDVFTGLPYYRKDTIELTLEEGNDLCSSSELVPLITPLQDSKLSYEILFQLNSLVHTHKLSLAAVDSDLIDLLTTLDLDSAMAVLQRMHKLQSTCYEPVSFIKTRLHILRKNLKNLPSLSHSRLTNRNMMSCHRVLITPSKICCLGPELESSNYVVKNFAKYASDFIRVTFVEEDWSKLSPNAVSTSIHQGIFSKPYRTNIYHRILSVLRDGIVIGEKRFEFLAFSASQLRANSVWMFASNEFVTAGDVRKWMGCFDKIRSVSKCAARMGQLFSSSTQTFQVPTHEIEVIPDIEVIADGIAYCFSDGIGKISAVFAADVASKCGANHTPSAFQIRYGGYKGVVAVDNRSVWKLSLRQSMRKFESDNTMLNITKCSESLPCYLNREIITLLTTLGVDDTAFEAMQDVQLSILDKMLTSRDAALEILECMNSSDVKNIIVKMLRQGYEPNIEPYLYMMLQSHRNNLLSDLRTRCRIFVPQARVVVGCLDEMGVLNYGQVYVRVSLTKAELQSREQSYFMNVDETTAVVVGKVLITKNPCLHPGDIRVLEAVFEVSLVSSGLTDCLIFPQKGERPHPNECSGGDLDGDLYFVSWDESLVPPRTVTPMDYTGRRQRLMNHDVTLEEIHKFFVDYMINDTLGAISTAHLVLADREPEKALSSKCLALATLHSMAVDFAKTGASAEMPRYLKPREYPDFMERWDKPMYTSQGVLGKLYRSTVQSRVHQNSDFILPEITQDSYDMDLEVDGFESFIDIAKDHKDMYLDKLSYLMNYYEASSEDEILTGNLRIKSSYLQRDNRRYGETKDRIMVAVKNLHREAKAVFASICGGDAKERQKLASAWYHVTYHSTYCRDSVVSCLGFPWIVGDILLDIKWAKSRKLSDQVLNSNGKISQVSEV